MFGVLEEPARCVLDKREPFCTPSLLIRRSLFDEIEWFDESLVINEDTDVIFRLSFKTKFCFVAEPLVRMDRTASRTDGLSEVCTSRDDRKYESMQRVYSKWLALPEVAGTPYEPAIRQTLRSIYFDSAEAKLHELRLRAAFREIRRLRVMGDGYTSIVGTLLHHKIAKLRRNFKGSGRVAGPKGAVNSAEGVDS
jgi:hypothetical protein